jgi:hypothetical protein
MSEIAIPDVCESHSPVYTATEHDDIPTGTEVCGTCGVTVTEVPKDCGEYHPLPCGIDKACAETGSD